MTPIVRSFASLAGALFLFSASLAENTNEHNPYYPEIGRGAIYQRCTDLAGGQVVLVVALEPGCEDLATIAYLRMSQGAHVVTAFMTNGDGTPSDLSGEAPFLLAARRKSEAYRANTLLGAEVYYLNLPDPGIVIDREALEIAWKPDSAISRIVRLIHTQRPDVIVISQDFREKSAGAMRRQVCTDLFIKAIDLMKREKGPTAWKVHRVLAETASGGEKTSRVPVTDLHPIWKKSYQSIGWEAARCYESLTAVMMKGRDSSRHAFAQAWPAGASPDNPFSGNVEIGSRRFLLLRQALQKVVGGKSAFAQSLDHVSSMIDSVDFILSHQVAGLTNQEKRWLIHWKNGLEALRCSILGVQIDYSSSDSLLTEHQIFHLRFKDFRTRTGKGKAEIFFPGASQHDWVVNESVNDHFDFEAPKDFLMLSPGNLEYNMPVSLYGLQATSLRGHLIFYVNRRGSTRSHNFSYKGDVPFRSGPRRTFELLTPMVRATNNEPVVVSLLNFSRDPFRGEITLADSSVGPSKKSVFLPSKDFLLNDTLRLKISAPLAAGAHMGFLELSGKGGIRPFIARAFDCKADLPDRIALLTGIKESPFAAALHRIGSQPELLNVSSLAQELDSFSGVLLLDRDAVAMRPDLQAELPRLHSWVEKGGQLVVMPQQTVDRPLGLVEGLEFIPYPGLPPTAELAIDTSCAIVRNPNTLKHEDWNGWVVARAWGSIRVAGGIPAEIAVRDQSTGNPLVARVHVGKGWVTLVALDLSSQLMNIHPGVHRLLANLLLPMRP